MPENTHPHVRSRYSAVRLWLAAGLVLLIVIVAALAYSDREFLSFAIAARRYRHGECWYVWDISEYCSTHYWEFTEESIVAWLGPARVDDTPDEVDYMDNYTGTIREWLGRLGLKPNGTERRLWYSEDGPPDHGVPDESGNICFLVRDGKIIGYYQLF